MISALDIENFKCFSKLRLTAGALTLLTGFNAAGKSSAIQPLLLLAQGAKLGPGRTGYSLNGPLVRLGTVGDVLPAGTSQANFKFGLSKDDNAAYWTFSCRTGARQVDLAGTEIQGPDARSRQSRAALSAKFDELLGGLSYISAVREGLADSYPLPDLDVTSAVDVGIDGRFAAYWYDRFVDETVPQARRHPNEPATSTRKQADAWFSTLFPNAQINVQHVARLAAESLQFRLSDIGEWRRPANVGYGFTYAFPILIALLAAKDGGQVVVIDSPEAHLHPRAQSQMGRMLATFASAGVQVIVETHSDHLLNGVRLAVKERVLDPQSLAIHFFTGATPTTHGVVSPAIDRDGRLSDWPPGFFDQSERDLAQLSGWN
jgi:predicted ATPase